MEFRRELGDRGESERNALVEQLYKLKGLPDEEPTLEQIGRALYKLLIPEDLHPLIRQNTRPLTLFGGEPLFPWEILHDGEEFIGVRFPIGRLPSWFEPPSRENPKQTGTTIERLKVAVVADPLGDLPASEREVGFLIDSLPTTMSQDVLLGDQATFEGLERIADEGPSLLHIASRTVAEQSEGPRISLTDTSIAPHTLRSLFPGPLWVFFHLQQTEETDIHPSSAALSFATTLLDKGAHGVVLSLSPSFTPGGRQMVGDYYRALFEGLPPAEALRSARQRFIRRNPSDPSWISFVFFGEPDIPLFKRTKAQSESQLRSIDTGNRGETARMPTGENQALPPSSPHRDGASVDPSITGESSLEYDFDLEQAIGIALMEAKNLRQDFIGTPHLFIGLTKCPGGVTRALLEVAGFEPKKVRDTIRYALGFGHASLDAKILPTQRCARALKSAEQNARDENDHVVREKHLLAAILQSGEGLAFEVLKKMGADPKKLYEKLLRGEIPQVRTRTGGETPTIDRYGRDLTLLAEQDALPHLTGRSEELMRLAQILLRRFKNNPLIIGEAGVGKTALVEGVAQRIVAGAVPEELRGRRLVELSLSSLVAGTRYRGDFEERLTMVIREAREHPEVILFLDEFHTVVGAGETHQGTLDAANILKPALARGEIRCIGATTPVEYRKYIEKDAALARRFHPLFLEEPSPEESFEIMRGSRIGYEEHHSVTIPDEVLLAAVDLAVRYLPDRRLPDKALDLIDEACALVTLRGASMPVLTPEGKILASTGKPVVNESVIYKVLADWTGIPIGEISREESKRLLELSERLKKSVLGQDEAVSSISQAVQIGRAGLKREGSPTAVLLFIGPSGVGKTELCRTLARELFGQESALIRLDMSEFSEKHSTSKLVGAPPGYVGHGEESQILAQLHHRPYSVVLLDEVEKAHPEVLDLFLQLFEEGRLTDSLGRTIDGRHAVFIMTSNILADRFEVRKSVGFQRDDKIEIKDAEISNELKRYFRPEFMNRIDEVLLFQPLPPEVLLLIAQKHFEELAERAIQQNVMLSGDEDALWKLVEASVDPTLGARPLLRAIERNVARPLSRMLLASMSAHGRTEETLQVRFTLIDDHPTLIQTHATSPPSFKRSAERTKQDKDKVD
tara:strand:- start:1102 stop:4521 length:3420 start_codon:yes stop_codon:yes gene_type:complete